MACKGLKLMCTALVEMGGGRGPTDRFYTRANREVANEIDFLKNAKEPKKISWIENYNSKRDSAVERALEMINKS